MSCKTISTEIIVSGSVKATSLYLIQRTALVTCDWSITLSHNGVHFNTDYGKQTTENFIHIFGTF